VTLKVLIVDDHWAIRQALADVLRRCNDLELVAQATDGRQALELAALHQPDLIVLDIALPHIRGMHVLRQMRSQGIKAKVLVFTMYPAEPYASMARQLGADGFLSKDADEQAIVYAIDAVAAGLTVFPGRSTPVAIHRTSAPAPSLVDRLSRREAEVFHALISGEANKSIAARLNISPKSVTTYRDRIFTKLGVDSIAQLATLAAHEEKSVVSPADVAS
jgi:DNA-binding NarL/FixJ family response regulator